MITSNSNEVKIMHNFKEITCEAFNDYIKQPSTKLVDVRNMDEVRLGVIKDAIHIPLAHLPNQYETLTDADNIIFYCHSGVRSAHAAAFLMQHVNSDVNVYNLVGGVVAWQKAGRQLTTLK